jgi:hypothetical protein
MTLRKPQAAVRVRFIDTHIHNIGFTTTKSYDYLVPDFISLAELHPGGHAVVSSAGRHDIYAIVEIQEVLPLGSVKAIKAIAGTAQMPLLSRQRQIDELTRQLEAREREVKAMPTVRFSRLADVDPIARDLYDRLVRLV